MKRISITRNGQITNQAEFKTEQELNEWFENEKKNKSFGENEREETDDMGKPTGKILPPDYTFEIEDITQEVKDKKDKEDKKIKDRKDRVVALAAIDWAKVTTIAQLKAIVKLLTEETLKDEE